MQRGPSAIGALQVLLFRLLFVELYQFNKTDEK